MRAHDRPTDRCKTPQGVVKKLIRAGASCSIPNRFIKAPPCRRAHRCRHRCEILQSDRAQTLRPDEADIVDDAVNRPPPRDIIQRTPRRRGISQVDCYRFAGKGRIGMTREAEDVVAGRCHTRRESAPDTLCCPGDEEGLLHTRPQRNDRGAQSRSPDRVCNEW